MKCLEMLLRWMLLLSFYSVFTGLQGQPSRPQYGQIRVQVFRSKEDSLRLVQLRKNIDDELARKKIRQPKVDSLMQLQDRILQEAIVYKMIYRPSRDYIVTDSLTKLSDFSAITRVCIYNKKEIPEVLWKCKNLEALELVNTSITELPKALSSLIALKTIHIYMNHSKRPLRLFKNETVTLLRILNESPEGLPRSFRKLKALTRLDLAENALKKFPNGARHNKKLSELSLQRNLLTLKGRIKPHPYLERLALHENQIEVVPASIRKFRNLKKLNFNINKITSVHTAISGLKKLEQLSFYNNRLTKIPEGAYRINSLREIDLFHNQIEELDAGFGNWQNLTTLYLSHNKVVSLPENIDTLRALEGLYVWDNRLGKLPESTGKLERLKYLRVNNNYLKEIPVSLPDLKLMEEIDLSHNYITEIPEGIFNYPNLKIIAIVNNPWNEKVLEFIPRKVEELRSKEIFVHVSDEQ